MALFGLMIAIVVNLFLKSSAMDWIISIVGVLLFVGLTAWDTQNVKRMAAANLDPQTHRQTRNNGSDESLS